MHWIKYVRDRLPQPVAQAYSSCVREVLAPVDVLQKKVEDYLSDLKRQSRTVEFLDLATAGRTAEECRLLLLKLSGGTDGAVHRAVQAAVLYFILEDDAEGDHSIVGFDDDLLVVQATAEALGWSRSEEEDR